MLNGYFQVLAHVCWHTHISTHFCECDGITKTYTCLFINIECMKELDCNVAKFKSINMGYFTWCVQHKSRVQIHNSLMLL